MRFWLPNAETEIVQNRNSLFTASKQLNHWFWMSNTILSYLFEPLRYHSFCNVCTHIVNHIFSKEMGLTKSMCHLPAALLSFLFLSDEWRSFADTKTVILTFDTRDVRSLIKRWDWVVLVCTLHGRESNTSLNSEGDCRKVYYSRWVSFLKPKWSEKNFIEGSFSQYFCHWAFLWQWINEWRRKTHFKICGP